MADGGSRLRPVPGALVVGADWAAVKTRNLIVMAVVTGVMIVGAALFQLLSGTLFGSPGALHDDEPTTGGTRIVVDRALGD